MAEFPLIKSLQTPDDKTPLPKGHKYTKHDVVVEGENITVNIPEKESNRFQSFIEESGGDLDKYNFNKIMRDLRGIRG